ncbi:MAG: hypothetical protein SP1CHLAM54_09100 [Chlamydiia bacterium]|nr:hypothetical protein [Chlamydiia bacterium]MCH9615816.1 hypothetical protein [Chlamydiia bacterium]MCH9628781.1 hypothetical protein [Chlamydiia bacterium]
MAISHVQEQLLLRFQSDSFLSELEVYQHMLEDDDFFEIALVNLMKEVEQLNLNAAQKERLAEANRWRVNMGQYMDNLGPDFLFEVVHGIDF